MAPFHCKLLDQPVLGNLEKPRVGRRDRVPTAAEKQANLAEASPPFRLIHSAPRQCGARPGELCRATIADVDRARCVISLKEHKAARKTGQPRRIPIGQKLGGTARSVGRDPHRRAGLSLPGREGMEGLEPQPDAFPPAGPGRSPPRPRAVPGPPRMRHETLAVSLSRSQRLPQAIVPGSDIPAG